MATPRFPAGDLSASPSQRKWKCWQNESLSSTPLLCSLKGQSVTVVAIEIVRKLSSRMHRLTPLDLSPHRSLHGSSVITYLTCIIKTGLWSKVRWILVKQEEEYVVISHCVFNSRAGAPGRCRKSFEFTVRQGSAGERYVILDVLLLLPLGSKSECLWFE